MTSEDNRVAYDLYAEIGRYLTKFNMLEINMRVVFERIVGTKFGPVLGHVQSISTRLDMVVTALKAVSEEIQWAATLITMEPEIRSAISFRNELSHGVLSEEGDSATLLLKVFDTNKKPRMTKLTVQDLRKKNEELEALLSGMLITSMGGIFSISRQH